MRKLWLMVVLAALSLSAAAAQTGQSSGAGQFTLTTIPQLVWGNAAVNGTPICAISTTTACKIPFITNTAETVNINVVGGTAPYTWVAATLPAGVTLGSSTGLTNVLNISPLAANPCTGTGSCFTVTVTDSSVIAQKVVFTVPGGDQNAVLLLPPSVKTLNVNGHAIPAK